MIQAVLALAVIGGILGTVLGVADMYLKVENDPRVDQVMEMLPNANCGGCGFPGCSGFASALVEGEATRVSTCVVCSAEKKEAIAEYLNSTPGPDGKTVKVTA